MVVNWFGRSRQIGQWVAIALCCCIIAIACSPQNNTSNGEDPGRESGRIIVGTTLKPRTLDPADAYEIPSLNLLYNIGDRLYTYDGGKAELVPQLATELPTISDDGLTYTIPLREGITFHDGTEFNAEAMVFSLQRFMENQGKPSFLLSDVVESVEATGDYELEITLNQPFAAFPSLLAFSGLCPVSPQAYEIGSAKFAPDTFVGTGPYKVADITPDLTRLDVFAGYWGDRPQNEGIDVQWFSSPANLFNAFRTGQVDVALGTLDSNQIDSLKKESSKEGWQEIAAEGNTLNYIIVNVQSEPLNQLPVRKALAAITDRQTINNRVLQGQAEPAYTLIPNTFSSAQPVFKTLYGDGNAELAKKLLTEAGYSTENPAVVEIWYASNSTKRGLIASTLKAIADRELEGLMQIEPNSVESTTAFQNLDKGVYPTFMLDWYADFLDPDNYVQPFLECPKGSAEKGCTEGASQYHGSFYYNNRINQLIAQQRQEQDLAKRSALLVEIQQLLAEEVPYIPLWFDKDFIFARPGISGVRIDANQAIPYSSIQG
ncbi:ABC transporter substrate-binding protein [Roseofilum casamattae]|uniref:ABC transporter substrate-binding protein n=1 Tax=Roseofilum casamattae BLCC-M143 TaxID=3022442 RepID=A0ABT7BZ82_9CYAN|nr:ABC transporter substrate-binding protein [Roseofilum casamattae]MDJ1184495.1 ABC transporter substrate-binding protein [Roseofilum casamattae BLCC-M143]